MRGYVFCHFYIKPLLQGVQANHASVEWSLFPPKSQEYKTYLSWAKAHKTLVYLNGGFTGQLTALAAALKVLAAQWKKKPPKGTWRALPVSAFYEDQQTLGGILTATGLVVPESVYGLSDEMLAETREELAARGLTPLEACQLPVLVRQLPVDHLLALLLRAYPLAN
jgi:hypothetical protein